MSNQKQQNVSQDIEMTLFSCININIETYVDYNPSTVFNEEIQTVDISSETNTNSKSITSFVENIKNEIKDKSIPIYNIFGIFRWKFSSETTSQTYDVNNDNFVLGLNKTNAQTNFSNIIFDTG